MVRDVARVQTPPMKWCALTHLAAGHALAVPGCHLPASKPAAPHLYPLLTARRRNKCMEDLQSTTRYVTWSLHTKSRSSLKAMLSKVGGRGRPEQGRRAVCNDGVVMAGRR